MFDTELVAAVRALPAFAAVKVLHENAGQGRPSPYAVYRLVSDEPEMELGGATSGYRRAVFQVDCYAPTAAAVRTLALALQSLTGAAAGPVNQWYETTDTTDDYEFPVDLDERGLRAAQVTILAVHTG